jgi:hypothetical protein
LAAWRDPLFPFVPRIAPWRVTSSFSHVSPMIPVFLHS